MTPATTAIRARCPAVPCTATLNRRAGDAGHCESFAIHQIMLTALLTGLGGRSGYDREE